MSHSTEGSEWDPAASLRRHDIQYNDTQQNDAQFKDTTINDTQ